ncbi:MAG: cell division protein ZapD [Gammaproteobacteria bacterium]|nr:cell division protein ZapD [Gammaproteobacteria bacterium]
MTTLNGIKFEHPLNERYRFFLRLEFLFNLVKHNITSPAAMDSHTSLGAILNIINVVGRIDIKSEGIKELDRITATLNPLKNTANIEQGRLDEILSSIKETATKLRAITGSIDHPLKDVELFKVLQQRNSIAGGLCDFDLPVYRYWLAQSPENRSKDLHQWFQPFNPLRYAIEIALKLVRESKTAKHELAQGGTYSQTLDTKIPCQIISVTLPYNTSYFVEFSGGKHRFTIRFMDATQKPRPLPTQQNVNFDLSCCIL